LYLQEIFATVPYPPPCKGTGMGALTDMVRNLGPSVDNSAYELLTTEFQLLGKHFMYSLCRVNNTGIKTWNISSKILLSNLTGSPTKGLATIVQEENTLDHITYIAEYTNLRRKLSKKIRQHINYWKSKLIGLCDKDWSKINVMVTRPFSTLNIKG